MTSRIGFLIASLVVTAVCSGHVPASADDLPCNTDHVGVCGGGDDGGFVGVGAGARPGVPGQTGSNGQAVGLAKTVKIYAYSPTCTGNDREHAEVTCGAALDSCQPTGRGFVRFWVWVAEVDTTTGRVLDPPGWVLEPDTVCFGPDKAGVPAKAAIAGILARDFKDLVVVKGVAHVDPHGSTLVNFENGFWTDAKTYALPAVRILGHRVVVTAKPEHFDWYFGDGVSAMDAGAGRRGTTDVAHTYTDKGLVKPYVVITWSGTYTVDGGGPLDVFGTATTKGDGTPLQVKEAHAELVSR